MSDVPPLTPLRHPHMIITNFNYEGSYLPGVICNIVVKADFDRSPSQMHHGIYIMGCILAAILDSSRKGGNFLLYQNNKLVNSVLALYSHVRCKPLDTP